jgi:hypothetical protein
MFSEQHRCGILLASPTCAALSDTLLTFEQYPQARYQVSATVRQILDNADLFVCYLSKASFSTVTLIRAALVIVSYWPAFALLSEDASRSTDR